MDTYKPTQPRCAPVVPEDIIHCLADVRLTIRSGNQEQQIQRDSKRQGPVFFKLVPIACFNTFRERQENVQRVQVRLDALRQRLTSYEPRHTGKGDERDDKVKRASGSWRNKRKGRSGSHQPTFAEHRASQVRKQAPVGEKLSKHDLALDMNLGLEINYRCRVCRDHTRLIPRILR